MLIIELKRCSKNAVLPKRAYPSDAGLDLHATEDLTLAPGERALVKTGWLWGGVRFAETNYPAYVHPRSGLAIKHGVTVLNTPGTIDAGFRGELCVILINHGNEDFRVTQGMRVAQLIVHTTDEVVCEEVEDVGESSRGTGGFGSTGA